MSTLVRGRITNLLKPLRASIFDSCRSKLGSVNLSSRSFFVGSRHPLSKWSFLACSPSFGLHPYGYNYRFCLTEIPCARGIRALSTEVSLASEPKSAEPIRGKRIVPEKEKVLHQAQHHNFPRARAIRKRFKTSTKKLKLVCKLVRRARVDAALMQLSLSPKRVARVVRQTIYDAKFNAANNHG